MYNVEDLLGHLFSTSWTGTHSNKLEVYWLHLRRDHITTSRMVHKDHVSRIGESPDQEWVDTGHLPQYFDPTSLESGVKTLADGTAAVCKVKFTHTCGNTDGGFVNTPITDEELEIVYSAPDKFEIRLLVRGSVTETYRPVSEE